MNDDLAFRLFAERRHRRQRDRWLALSLALLGITILSNALWFYNWRVRETTHHRQLAQAEHITPADSTPVACLMPAASGQPATTMPVPISPPDTFQQPQENERCVGGIIVRRNGNTLESTGQRCRH